MNSTEARAAYLRFLMDRVRQDNYPSVTHMDLIEQALPPQLIPDYVQLLLDKCAQEAFPSVSMLQRIAGLVEAAR
jgi:hypothetical protein